jgi:hypothetical protein
LPSSPTTEFINPSAWPANDKNPALSRAIEVFLFQIVR